MKHTSFILLFNMQHTNTKQNEIEVLYLLFFFLLSLVVVSLLSAFLLKIPHSRPFFFITNLPEEEISHGL